MMCVFYTLHAKAHTHSQRALATIYLQWFTHNNNFTSVYYDVHFSWFSFIFRHICTTYSEHRIKRNKMIEKEVEEEDAKGFEEKRGTWGTKEMLVKRWTSSWHFCDWARAYKLYKTEMVTMKHCCCCCCCGQCVDSIFLLCGFVIYGINHLLPPLATINRNIRMDFIALQKIKAKVSMILDRFEWVQFSLGWILFQDNSNDPFDTNTITCKSIWYLIQYFVTVNFQFWTMKHFLLLICLT